MALVAQTVALDIIRSIREPLARIRKGDADLARQIKRAVDSVALNVGEGERRVGRDGAHHFRIAAGSAKETQAGLRSAEAWGYVSSDEIEEPLRHIDRQLGLLWGLTHRR